jgi:hypothetical protein
LTSPKAGNFIHVEAMSAFVPVPRVLLLQF